PPPRGPAPAAGRAAAARPAGRRAAGSRAAGGGDAQAACAARGRHAAGGDGTRNDARAAAVEAAPPRDERRTGAAAERAARPRAPRGQRSADVTRSAGCAAGARGDVTRAADTGAGARGDVTRSADTAGAYSGADGACRAESRASRAASAGAGASIFQRARRYRGHRLAAQIPLAGQTPPAALLERVPSDLSVLGGKLLLYVGREDRIDALDQRERRLVRDGQSQRRHHELRIGAQPQPARVLLQHDLRTRQRVLKLRDALDLGFDRRQ